MKYTHFIFDVDGTIVDTEQTGVRSLQKTILDLTGKDVPYEEAYKFFGIPSSKVAPILGYEKEELFAQTWERNFLDLNYLMKAFPGVPEMLKALKDKGIRLGVVTSRSRYEIEHDHIFAEFADLFDYVVSAEDTTKHKPDPEPMLKVIEKASKAEGRTVLPSECLYLGDTKYDYGCGHDAGCDFALADWRNRGYQGIPAEYKFSSAEEVLKLA